MPGQQHPFSQSDYQVRLDWGLDGLVRITPADVVVIVDVLRFSTTVTVALESGADFPLDAAAHEISINGAPLAEAAGRSGALVLLGGLRNAGAVGAAIYAEQARRGERTSIAVIACGELAGRGDAHRNPDAHVRFAVEDQLGAGAVIDALAELGIDHSSPEAAVAGESFRALRRAATHLITASGSGRELAEAGLRNEVLAAATADAASVVPVLREGVFRPF
ncbi:MAG: 2-phosphosulfolactate phosphatase [Microbacterium pygmaeum]